MSHGATLPSAVARELIRVTTIRCHYEETAAMTKMANNLKPAMAMMTRSLNAAVEAIEANDLAAMTRALADLREYSE